MDQYCSQNDGDCSVKPISFQDWFKAWFIDTVEICVGCHKEIHFWDQAFEHCGLDGAFCSDCAKIFQAGSIPELLK